MFCPQCQAEYRQGFIVCADCEVELVPFLTTESNLPSLPPSLVDEGFSPIWRGISQKTCVEICRELKATGIVYQVTQSLRSRMGAAAEFNYELSVSDAEAPHARELLGLPDVLVEDLDVPPEPTEDQALPEPKQEDFVESRFASTRRAPTTHWYPESAIVQIWHGPMHDKDGILEMSLRENGVRTRADQLPDGQWALFVLPEDEFAAREIVRQIVEGTPPS